MRYTGRNETYIIFDDYKEERKKYNDSYFEDMFYQDEIEKLDLAFGVIE